MRRASTLFSAAAVVATGVLALAGAASAQSARESVEARGLRYLSWQGRGEPTTLASGDTARRAPVRADLRRPNTIIPHGGFARSEAAAPTRPAASPAPARRTLTPANAWLRPATPPPESPPAPAPTAVASAPPTESTPQPRPGPDYLPDQGGRGQPAPAEVVYPAPAPSDARTVTAPADPMAPRRDAPIFRLQRDAPPRAVTTQAAPPAQGEAAPEPRRVMESAASGDGPRRQGARYYSVHRQNGREPDPLEMPEPNYVDALVVSSIDTLASQDLAEPAPGPTLIRDRDGNTRSVPTPSDGDHQ